MTVNINSGLQLHMQSAIAAAKTISAITLAAPGVVSSTAHGYSNGDVVLLEVQGMVEVNGNLYKVVNVATDSFQLEGPDGATGIDTSGFNAFSSGTAKKITFGTSIPGVQDFSPSGGDIKTTDTSTVNDLRDTEAVTGVTAMSYDLEMQWDPANVAQQAMLTAFQSLANRAFRIVWPSGAYAMWYGTVGYNAAPRGGKGNVTTAPAKITMLGQVTVGV